MADEAALRSATEDETDYHDAKMLFVKELRQRDAWYWKMLRERDVREGRDMLSVDGSWVDDQVLFFMPDSAAERIRRGESDQRFVVKDCDSDTFHELCLRKLENGRFVFCGSWEDEFVIRRNLKWGDTVGLCWHFEKFMFSFTAFYGK